MGELTNIRIERSELNTTRCTNGFKQTSWCGRTDNS